VSKEPRRKKTVSYAQRLPRWLAVWRTHDSRYSRAAPKVIHRQPGVRRGVTLLEMMLAIGLITLISATMFAFYHQSLRTRDRGQKAISSSYLAKIVAHQIAEEVRGANGFVNALGPGVTGTDRLLTIQTVVIPDKEVFRRLSIQDDVPPAQCDLRQVSYYLAYDDEETHTYPNDVEADKPLGLVRREIKTFHQVVQFEDDRESVELDLLSPELKYVRFRYFDGVEWLDKWDIGQGPEGGMGNSLPQAVEITVGYSELPPPEEDEEEEEIEDSDLTPSEPELYSADAYTVMVRLPQADAFFGSRLMRAQKRSRTGASDAR